MVPPIRKVYKRHLAYGQYHTPLRTAYYRQWIRVKIDQKYCTFVYFTLGISFHKNERLREYKDSPSSTLARTLSACNMSFAGSIEGSLTSSQDLQSGTFHQVRSLGQVRLDSLKITLCCFPSGYCCGYRGPSFCVQYGSPP